MTASASTRDKTKHLSDDQAMLKQLVQAACDVELYTIPLYGTALYSIRGFHTADDGSIWPGLRPKPVDDGDTSAAADAQRAWNAIFSVYIQEMFHLQLASNLSLALGQSPTFNAPSYTDTTSIPCVGKLPTGVTGGLGALSADLIEVFKFIETPDWDTTKKPPAAPFDTMPTVFDTIGHLYESIRTYVNLQYSDGTMLFDTLYVDAKAPVNEFGEEYAPVVTHSGCVVFTRKAGMHVQIPAGMDPNDARARANTMIDAIVVEGEGASAAKGVPPMYTPDESRMSKDSSPDDAAVRAFWDTQSHYKRFEDVGKVVDKITTWSGNPVTLAELTPPNPTPEQTAEATARYNAYVSSAIKEQAQNVLNSSYTGLLTGMTHAFAGHPSGFPFGAMTGLSSKVVLVWVTQQTPTWTTVTPPAPGTLHACQGLNSCKTLNLPTQECAGLASCATAAVHSCVGSNSCANQGGCGYPAVTTGAHTDSPPNFIPGRNTAALNGGCGAPIPATQVFHNPYKGLTVNNAAGHAITGKVWDRARKLFLEDVVPGLVTNGKITAAQAQSLKDNPPSPSPLRVVLQRT